MSKVDTWLRVRNVTNAIIKRAKEEQDFALDAADDAELPEHLRPATASDIVEDHIIWYVREGYHHWKLVENVLRPDDEFKAYTAHDGCRYGLDGAFVEVKGVG